MTFYEPWMFSLAFSLGLIVFTVGYKIVHARTTAREFEEHQKHHAAYLLNPSHGGGHYRPPFRFVPLTWRRAAQEKGISGGFVFAGVGFLLAAAATAL